MEGDEGKCGNFSIYFPQKADCGKLGGRALDANFSLLLLLQLERSLPKERREQYTV